MADGSAVPENVQKHVHPLARRLLKSARKAWELAWPNTEWVESLCSFLDVGITGLKERGGDILGSKDRILEYFRIAYGYRKAELILPRPQNSWEWGEWEKRCELYTTVAGKAYECLRRDLFDPALGGKLDSRREGAWYRIMARDSEMAAELIRFAESVDYWPTQEGLAREFFVKFLLECWNTDALQDYRPRFVCVLDEWRMLWHLLDSSIHVDKPSMVVLEELALQGSRHQERYSSIGEAIADGHKPAQVLLLLRVKHAENRRQKALQRAEQERLAKVRRGEEIRSAEAARKKAEDELARLKGAKSTR